MYVCICHQVTDKEIQSAVRAGCCTLKDLQKKTGLGTQCGSCCQLASEVMNEVNEKNPPLAAQAAPFRKGGYTIDNTPIEDLS